MTYEADHIERVRTLILRTKSQCNLSMNILIASEACTATHTADLEPMNSHSEESAPRDECMCAAISTLEEQ